MQHYYSDRNPTSPSNLLGEDLEKGDSRMD